MIVNMTMSARTPSSVWPPNQLMKVLITNNLSRNSVFKSVILIQIVRPTSVNRFTLLHMVTHGSDTV